VIRNPTSRKVGPGTYLKHFIERKLSYNIHTEKSFQMLDTSNILNTERDHCKTQLGSFYSSGSIDEIFKEKIPIIPMKGDRAFSKLHFTKKQGNFQLKRNLLKRKIKGKTNIFINLSKENENWERNFCNDISMINSASNLVENHIFHKNDSKLNEPSLAVSKVQIKLQPKNVDLIQR